MTRCSGFGCGSATARKVARRRLRGESVGDADAVEPRLKPFMTNGTYVVAIAR
jgi:hypothetical protein